MVNGLAVLGWGVGGIEAEAAMLGQPITMLIPEVVGFKLTGKINEGITATDLVLTVTEMLRKKGVVGKFVEFYGPGLDHLSLEDQATIANMAPEYGATCGFFPVDADTLDYLDDLRPRCRARGAGRGLCQGAGHVPRRPSRPIRSSPTRSNSISPPSCRRSRARSARRTAWRSTEAAEVRQALHRSRGGRKDARAPDRRREPLCRRRRDRRRRHSRGSALPVKGADYGLAMAMW